MRKILAIIFWAHSICLMAQNEDSVVIKPKLPEKISPVWIAGFDLANLLDDYVAILPYVEYSFNEDISIMQELGYIVVPESYNSETYNSYFGFEGRTEIKYYYRQNQENRVRNWMGIDVAFQYDFYEDEIWINEGNFSRLSNVTIERESWGMHLRLGSEKILSGGRTLINASLGVGRRFISLTPDDVNSVNTNISDRPVLDPFSVNLRIKIAFVIKKR